MTMATPALFVIEGTSILRFARLGEEELHQQLRA
jgi:hypothetical protein